MTSKFILSAIFWVLVAWYRQDTIIEGFALAAAVVNYGLYVATQFIEWNSE